jgi:hypothetical protein
MNPTKFGSPHLDIPSSSCEFPKFACISEKNKEKLKTQALIARAQGQLNPPASETKVGDNF